MYRTLLIAIALTACNPEDPCASYDVGICDKQAECEVFSAMELGTQGAGWCIPQNALSGPVECMTSPEADCVAGQHYASPADADGNPTDACYGFTGCQAPSGWVDCTNQPALDLATCDA